MEKKLRRRLFKIALLGTLLLLSIVLVVSGAVFLSYTQRTVKTQAQLLKGSDLSYEEIIELFATEVEGFRLTVIGEDGWAIYDSKADISTLDNFRDYPEFTQAMEVGEGSAIRFSPTDQSLFSYMIQVDEYHVLRLARVNENILNVFRQTILIVLLFCPIIIISSFLVARSITKMMVRPVKKLATDMEKVSQQGADFILTVPEDEPDGNEDIEEDYPELEPFIKAIRTRNIEILENTQMRQDFTANVSHELKTPLTSISCYAELLESGMVSEEDSKEFLARIRVNVGTLLSTINDIIHLSELDTRRLDFEKEKLDLYQLARECVESLQVNAEKSEITLFMKHDIYAEQGETCFIEANKEMIQELIENLCSNALRYMDKPGTVEVCVKTLDVWIEELAKYGDDFVKSTRVETSTEPVKMVSLSVKDTGIGISKEDQKRIFERFYRVDKGRSKESGGTGLGLSIVKHIVKQHGATLELQSEVGRGTEITVLFPRVQ